MCNVYSFSGFAKILIKNQIKFSFRDFLSDEKVDALIQTLINKTCNENSYTGAGIARSCFIDFKGDCAIKVDKSFYVDYSDECARDEYNDMLYWDNKRDEWEDGGWTTNTLNTITHYKESYICDQNIDEIDLYVRLMKSNSIALQYMPRLYARSANKAVEILEYCGYCSNGAWEEDRERFDFICEHFDDTHDGNFGINRQGKLVILDVGFGSTYED